MLEIPLFDQHFPLSEHRESLLNLLPIIESRVWEEINIIVGQDMLHNDDMRGRTSSGRPIEKVDMVKAWDMARDFYASVIESAVSHSKNVKIIYSKGNHDESMSWAFVQMLKAMYPTVYVDDSLKQRKCIFWRNCFIGITHGAYKKSSHNDLRGQFTIQFATEFSSARVREIHAGHLHQEEERDIYGVVCRRLSRNGNEDEWSDDEGLVGATKRFMVFKWKPGWLAGIDFI
jgi:UDP-2,3-diacylglucosamine pyrophosphatase LpxH